MIYSEGLSRTYDPFDLSNAAKVARGNLTEITAKKTSGNWILLSFKDKGPGIFHRFERAVNQGSNFIIEIPLNSEDRVKVA